MKTATRKTIAGYAFILPWLIALALFIGFPFLGGFYFSFCDFPPLKGPLFIGLENYTQLLHDPVFHRSLGVTLIYGAVAIPLGVLLALTLALLLNTRIRGQSVYRVVFFLPHLVPTVVVALLWLWIFNPDYGLLNLLLRHLMHWADLWTGLFFDLDAASAGHAFATGRTAILLAGPLAVVLAFSPWLQPELDKHPRGARFVRAASVITCALATLFTAYAVMVRIMPGDVRKLHSPGWLSDASPFPSAISSAPSWALWGIIVMSMWGVGQMAVIYLAKLQDVPVQLYEAADIDGASWWKKTRHITIPLISPVILFNVVMAIIGTFQVFTEPYIMTRGGPEDKTRFVAMFIYDHAFLYQNVGYAAAVAWILFLLIVGLTLLAFRLSRRHVYYAGR